MTTIERIITILDELGIPKAVLERRARLPENKIHKWAKAGEKARIPMRDLVRMAEAMGVPIERLTSDDPPPPDPVRGHLDDLVSRYGAEACVAWILDGIRTRPEVGGLASPATGRPLRTAGQPGPLGGSRPDAGGQNKKRPQAKNTPPGDGSEP